MIAGDTFPAAAGAALASRLGLTIVPDVDDVWTGATSTVIRWGEDRTVKIPHRDEESIRACLRHAEVSRAAAALGVRCAPVELVTELEPWLAVPVMVSRLLPGRALAPGTADDGVWRAVGGQLALLHSATEDQVPRGLRRFQQTSDTDPAVSAGRLVERGVLARGAAREVATLADDLRPAALAGRQVFCHGDIHAENVVAGDEGFVGLLDFAGAGWLDAAWDFAAMPLAAVVPAVAAYRDAGGTDDGLPERIAWCRLQLGLARVESGTEHGVTRVLAEAAALLEDG